jgi:hypothetical protein
VADDSSNPSGGKRVKNDTLDASSGVVVLGPNSGNLHSFKALEDSAFFDILAPPYDADGGRPCTYYQTKPSNRVGDVDVQLAAYEPENLVIEGIEWTGHRVRPS